MHDQFLTSLSSHSDYLIIAAWNLGMSRMSKGQEIKGINGSEGTNCVEVWAIQLSDALACFDCSFSSSRTSKHLRRLWR